MTEKNKTDKPGRPQAIKVSAPENQTTDIDEEIANLEKEAESLSSEIGHIDLKVLAQDIEHKIGPKKVIIHDLSEKTDDAKPKPADVPKRKLHTLTISPDKMKVLLSVIDPGKDYPHALSEKDIFGECADMGIVFGLNKELIIKTVKEYNKKRESINDFVIAEGMPAVNGQNAALVQSLEFKTWQEAGLRQEIEYPCAFAAADQVIATVLDATSGQDGQTVTGEKLKATAGSNPFEAGSHVRKKTDGDKVIFTPEYAGLALRNETQFSLVQCSNAVCKITVSPDSLKAFAALTPRVGPGNELTIPDIQDSLAEAKIVYGIKEDAITEKIEILQNSANIIDFLIAEGIPAINGKDGSLEFVKTLEADGTMTEDAYGRIDYRRKKNVINSVKDEHLFTLYPPQKAEQVGKDVYGKDIPASDGLPVKLEILEGIRAEDGENGIKKYFSELNGEIAYDKEKQTIKVAQVKVIDNLDIAFGNLMFEGNVTVNNNIEDGLEVKIKGDLYVKGNIGLCSVEVDGNIICEGGILTKEKGLVSCTGNLQAKFIENSNIHTGGNVSVEKAILNSKVACQKSVFADKDKCFILGSHIQAMEHVNAFNIGNPSGAKSTIEIGVNFKIVETYNELITKIKELRDKIIRANLVIAKFEKIKAHTDQFNDKLKREYAGILAHKNEMARAVKLMKEKADEILSELNHETESALSVKNDIYPDTVVVIGNSKIKLASRDKGVSFYRLKDNPNILKKYLVSRKTKE